MNFLSTSNNNNATPNKKDSIDEILIKSQRLVHFTNHPSIVSKGITELTDSSKQWKSQDIANNNISMHNHSEAYRLLSQKNFDAKKLNEDLNLINVKTIDDSSTLRLEGTDIEGYLCHQHDMIILATIEDSRISAEEHMQEMQRKWASAEWAHARGQFMDTIGHKVHQWEGRHSKLPAVSSSAVGIFSPSTPSVVGVSTAKKLSHTPVTGGFPSHSLHIDKTPLSTLMQTHSTIVRDLNILSHQQHSTQVSNKTTTNPVSVLNDNYHHNSSTSSIQKDSRTALKPYTQLAESIKIPQHGIATSLVSDGLNLADLIAYQSHLYLLAHAVGEYSQHSSGDTLQLTAIASTNTPSSTSSPGYFSPICFDSADIAQTAQSHAFHTVEERRHVLSQGTKKFLQVQIAEKWQEALDEALHTGDWNVLSSSEGNSRQQQLKSYVAYLHHTKHLPEQCASVLSPLNQLSSSLIQQQLQLPDTPYHLPTNTNTTRMNNLHSSSSSSSSQKPIEVPLWVYIYHCLRSGNLVMIETELSCCVTEGYSHGEFAVLKILQTVFKLTSASSMNAAANLRTKTANKNSLLDENEIRLLVEQIESCRSFYDQEMSRTTNGDPYKSLVLNLLSLADKESLASASLPGFSIEDFMWCNLWFIEHMRVLKPYISNKITLSASISERGLFELILEYGGADYFDDDRTNPFRYAMVLTCCQRYGDAIAHLWQCNKVFPAAHLTVIALYYGLVLPHIPLSMNPAMPISTTMNTTTNSTSTSNTYRNIYTHIDPSPVTILKAFTGPSSVLEKYPSMVVDYLVSLDANWISFAPSLAGDIKEVIRVKCQAMISTIFQEYICTSCTREQLDEIVGRPITQPNHTATSPYRIPGARLDDYFTSIQIETLLCTCAYYLLTSRKEIEAAIYLYQLAGKYTEVLEELCVQLTNVFLPYPGTISNPSDKMDRYRLNTEAQHIQNYQQTRLKWLNFCEYFLLTYRMVLDDNYNSLVNTLQVLMNLLSFADAFSTNLIEKSSQSISNNNNRMTPKEIYSILDDLQIIPNNEQQMDTFNNQYNNKFIRFLIDDILLMAMDCTVTDYKIALQDRMKSSNVFNTSILTTQDIYIQLLKHRAYIITNFAYKIKTRLNRSDTPSILSNIESSAFIM